MVIVYIHIIGLVFSSRIAAHSWEFLPKDNKKREMMARMAFSNLITLRVLIWVYYHIGEPWTPKLLLTFLSVFLYLFYHLVIIAWFVRNSSLKQSLFTITEARHLPGIYCTTVRDHVNSCVQHLRLKLVQLRYSICNCLQRLHHIVIMVRAKILNIVQVIHNFCKYYLQSTHNMADIVYTRIQSAITYSTHFFVLTCQVHHQLL